MFRFREEPFQMVTLASILQKVMIHSSNINPFVNAQKLALNRSLTSRLTREMEL